MFCLNTSRNVCTINVIVYFFIKLTLNYLNYLNNFDILSDYSKIAQWKLFNKPFFKSREILIISNRLLNMLTNRCLKKFNSQKSRRPVNLNYVWQNNNNVYLNLVFFFNLSLRFILKLWELFWYIKHFDYEVWDFELMLICLHYKKP